PGSGARFICSKLNWKSLTSTRASRRLPLAVSPVRGERMRRAAGPGVSAGNVEVAKTGPAEAAGATAPLWLPTSGVAPLVQAPKKSAASSATAGNRPRNPDRPIIDLGKVYQILADW